MAELLHLDEVKANDNVAFEKFNLLCHGANKQALTDFIFQRAAVLASEDRPSPENMGPFENNMWSGAISPNTEVQQSFFAEGFHIDDPELLTMFCDIIFEMQQKHPEIPTISLLLSTIDNLTRNYFGG